MADDQRPVLEFLAARTTHDGASVERIDTHASVVFLAGPRVLKLKRAVRFDYLDYSTIELRRAACEAEVRLNRRTAPALYRGVVPVTREADGSLALAGAGVAVDWLVEMARFDQDQLLDRLAARHALALEQMRPLASAIASFHAQAAERRDHGGRDGIQRVIDGNAEGLREHGQGILDRASADALTAAARAELAGVAPLLDQRRADGHVRECHGDLHLRNIVLLEGRPLLFDAIEFNDDFACIDVVYDVAFLLMDLIQRGLPAHANAVLNGYMVETGDLAGLRALPLLLSCRAAVRAKTSATAARVQDRPDRADALQDAARRYLTLAAELLRRATPQLVAVGGLSGSGKSTLARAWAPSVGGPPGALVLRSDEIRKALMGVSPLTRLGADGYSESVTRQVYAELRTRAETALTAGHAVIVDAVFGMPEDREALEATARTAGVPFTGVWLDAPPEVLSARVGTRTGDASDANAAVIEAQLRRPTGDVTWHRLDAARGPAGVLEAARALPAAGQPGS